MATPELGLNASSVFEEDNSKKNMNWIRSSLRHTKNLFNNCFFFVRWNGLQDDEWDIRSTIGDEDLFAKSPADRNVVSTYYGLQYSSWECFKNQTFEKRLGSLNHPVFIISSLAVWSFLVLVVTAKPYLQSTMPDVLDFVALNFGWFYVLLPCCVVITLGYMIVSRYGDLKLGEGDPEYPVFTWISMMFSAGVGIALVYYGCSQPLDYAMNPPIEDTSDRVAREQAVALAMYLQGYLSWPGFSFMGLTLAYLHHAVGLPISIRSIAAPLLGKYTYRWPGHFIDVIAVVGTAFGIAATLGVGATQLLSGVTYTYPNIGNGIGAQLVLLTIVGVLAGISVLCGISKGMATMANINMLLAFIWMLCYFFIDIDPVASVGQWFPISHVMAMIQNIGMYCQVMAQRAFRTASDNPSEMKWMARWPYFFSGWQLTWTPFVSTFLAAISKGRTIRSYIFATLLVPSFVNLVWFTIFGRIGILVSDQWREVNSTELIDQPRELLIYTITGFLRDQGTILASTANFLTFTVIVVLTIFIVTSADSATYVIVTLNSGGNPSRARKWLKLYWLICVLLICGLMLWLGGIDLFNTLEAILIVMGLPLGFLMVIALASFIKLMRLLDLPAVALAVQEKSSTTSSDLTRRSLPPDEDIVFPIVDDAAVYQRHKELRSIENGLSTLGGIAPTYTISADMPTDGSSDNNCDDFVG